MNAVLIATDFSDAASNAAAYGVELAKAMNARAILFSACEHVPLPISEIPAIIEPEELQQRVLQQLNEDSRMLETIHEIPVQTTCCLGTAREALQQAIHEQGADIVVAGMKIKGRRLRRWLGSVVTSWMHNIPVSMIVVPETAPFTYISNIALAVDHDISPANGIHSLQSLREVCDRFHAQLYVVQVIIDSLQPAKLNIGQPLQLTTALETLMPRYECITGANITTSLVNFIDMNNINLLAMIPRQHPWFEQLFVQSTTRSMALDCPVPLLVLPEQLPTHGHLGQ